MQTAQRITLCRYPSKIKTTMQIRLLTFGCLCTPSSNDLKIPA